MSTSRFPALRPRPIALVVALVLATPAWSQGVDWIREHYSKTEQAVPMRDGTKLFVVVYAPKDTSQRYPIMLNRTPYGVGPYGPTEFKANLGPNELFARDGFIFAYEDVRGQMMSEGVFVDMRPIRDEHVGPGAIDESTDAFDTIAWLVENVPGNNGRVGQWGISYPGFYASCGAINAHPALVASSPQAPVTDWFTGDDFHHNGALYLPHAFQFLNGFGVPRSGPEAQRAPPVIAKFPADGYRFFLELGAMRNAEERWFKGRVGFWSELMEHETFDAWWQKRDLRPHLRDIHHAVMTVGGWFDAEDLFGALQTYKTIEATSPLAKNTLVMGPWVHGGWARNDGDALGSVRFGSRTSPHYRSEIELPWFRHLLKDGADPKLAEATIFETGANRWRGFTAWPPSEAVGARLSLLPAGGLGFEAPTAPATEFDEYISDPAKPVPHVGGIEPGMSREHMVEDQRFAAARPDVLVYETPVLTEDVTLAGPVSPTLFVSTSGTDSDFVVKLIDVYPADFPDPPEAAASQPASRPSNIGPRMGGYQQLVRGEPFRGKFRNSFTRPEPFEPGKPARIAFTMPDVCHTFLRGHRIMVQIQSSWFPLVNLNPQTFTNINTAQDADFKKASQRVFHTPDLPSHIDVLLLK